jgi:biotin carboxyl carrier protein
MKMEIPVSAPVAGELSKWLVSSEDIVSEGQVIGTLTAEE